MQTNLAQTCLLLILLAVAAPAVAQEAPVKLGPNGGHLIQFNREGTVNGEVLARGDRFEMQLIDGAGKPIALEQQTLSVIGGERNKPVELAVEKKEGKFVTSIPPGEDLWILFQLRTAPGARKLRGRLHYDTKPCAKCGKPRWLCKCGL